MLLFNPIRGCRFPLKGGNSKAKVRIYGKVAKNLGKYFLSLSTFCGGSCLFLHQPPQKGSFVGEKVLGEFEVSNALFQRMHLVLQLHNSGFEVEHLLSGCGGNVAELLQLLVERGEVFRFLQPFATKFLCFCRGEVVEAVAGFCVIEDKFKVGRSGRNG